MIWWKPHGKTHGKTPWKPHGNLQEVQEDGRRRILGMSCFFVVSFNVLQILVLFSDMFSSLRCSGALKQRNAEDKSAMPDQHQGKIIHLLLYVFVCTITAIYFPMPKILHLFDNSGKKDHSLLSEAHFGCLVSSKDSQSCKWRPFHNKVDNDMSCVYILKQRTNLSFTSIYIYLHLFTPRFDYIS